MWLNIIIMPGETLMRELSSIHEEIEAFTLSPEELQLVTNKYKPTRVGFAVLLKFFHLEHKFPNKKEMFLKT